MAEREIVVPGGSLRLCQHLFELRVRVRGIVMDHHGAPGAAARRYVAKSLSEVWPHPTRVVYSSSVY